MGAEVEYGLSATDRLPAAKMRLPVAQPPPMVTAAATFVDQSIRAALPRTALHLGLSLMLLTNLPAALPGGHSLALPALAGTPFTAEQKIVAEAWRTTDREYVDRDFAGQDWFQTRQAMVKKKLTSRDQSYDEIRGMLATLGDKYTRFLTPAMWAVRDSNPRPCAKHALEIRALLQTSVLKAGRSNPSGDRYNAIFAVATGDVAGIGVELQADPVDPDAVGGPTRVHVQSDANGAAFRPGIGEPVEASDATTEGN